jgi:dephospho-CoA kinase
MAYCIGLTGGIGSGKSTVADFFSVFGIAIIDADAIAHALTASGGRAIGPIRRCLGEELIAPDGALDRAATRRRVFTDASVRKQLEAILHPLVHEDLESALDTEIAQNAPYVILAIPLFFETFAYRERTQRTLLVDCPVSTQFDRVSLRPGLTPDLVSSIIETQLSRAVRLQLADDVIWNGGSDSELRWKVAQFHQSYLRRAGKVQ